MEVRPRPKKVHVIINPATARRVALLSLLNDHFRPKGIQWDVSVTHGEGDGVELAQRAREEGADVVGVFGGDGSVMEVATGLVHTDTPLLILPGGTGNVVAIELQMRNELTPIARDIARACNRVCGDTFRVRKVDVGKIAEHYFLLRAGCGIETQVVQDATRQLKQQFGKWAYMFAAIRHVQEQPSADYELTLDDRDVIRDRGVACVVANTGAVGLGTLSLSPSVDIDDGKLDVFFLRKANLEGLLSVGAKMIGLDRDLPEKMEPSALSATKLIGHWQVKKIKISTDPVLDIQIDGDVLSKTPQTIEVEAQALGVVV